MHKHNFAKATLRPVMFVGCLTVAVFSLPTFAQDSSIPFNRGGDVKGAALARRQIAETGRLFRIEGDCRSSCTIFLKLKNVCIDPNADLAFHMGPPGSKATRRMLGSYNTKLRNFLIANHYMETPDFHIISGRDMITKFGYRECPPRK